MPWVEKRSDPVFNDLAELGEVEDIDKPQEEKDLAGDDRARSAPPEIALPKGLRGSFSVCSGGGGGMGAFDETFALTCFHLPILAPDPSGWQTRTTL